MFKCFPAVTLLFTISLSLGLASSAMANDKMTQAKLEGIITAMADSSKGEGGIIRFSFDGVPMMLMTSAPHNRMRVVAPVTEYAKLTPAQIMAMMESNYHKALDARYAVSDGVVYAAYIHPLQELTQGQLELSVIQVATLVRTFGTEYTSGVLSFSGKN